MKIKLLSLLLMFSGPAFAENVSRDLVYSVNCDSNNEQVTISFVGDILVHDMLYRTVLAESQHFSQIWRRTDSLIQKADYSVGNLEGPSAMGIDRDGKDHGDVGFVYDRTVYSGTDFSFNYHPRILSDLKKSGYDLLTTANNHALDRRSIGIDKTLDAAKQAGLITVGTRSSSERNGAFYKIVDIKNLKVAFLGCTEMTNGKADTKDQILYCYSGQILKIIEEVTSRSDVDALIVMPHWGVEYAPVPEEQQRNFAQKYLEAGALAVIGSHPHVLQPWQKYVTKDGRETLIAYSLGNFVAGQAGIPRKTGVVVYLGLSQEGSKKAKIFGVAYNPTYRRSAELYPVSSTDPVEILNYVTPLFGSKGRIEPKSDLMPFLCSQKIGQ
ncbi:CapA family protein [Bdellovibrio sp. HCB-162]|uniref:CapA family protein n=1 Tax=Bdellovibrio sp. HCB-162 TaxID=3394234 RepID=UPI0039BCBD40